MKEKTNVTAQKDIVKIVVIVKKGGVVVYEFVHSIMVNSKPT